MISSLSILSIEVILRSSIPMRIPRERQILLPAPDEIKVGPEPIVPVGMYVVLLATSS
jgi:hypothetical protein